MLKRATTVIFLCATVVTSWTARSADVQIRDLNDLEFGVVPPTIGTIQADTPFCVAMEPRGRYSLQGIGSGPNGEFALIEVGNSAHRIGYVVRISDRGRRFGGVLQPGVALGNLRASRQRANNRCNPAARLRIEVPGNQLKSAAPGRYRGTLSLTVAPE